LHAGWLAEDRSNDDPPALE